MNYVQQVGALPVGKEFTGLIIVDPFFWLSGVPVRIWADCKRVLDTYITVAEVATLLPEKEYMPCFYVRGTLHTHRIPRFNIDPLGEHLLCFTGRPVILDIEDNYDYRLKNAIFRHYWEDNRIGYLTQVIEIDAWSDLNDNEYIDKAI